MDESKFICRQGKEQHFVVMEESTLQLFVTLKTAERVKILFEDGCLKIKIIVAVEK
jgi:hypothetical protein